jgi:hypothetical protein
LSLLHVRAFCAAKTAKAVSARLLLVPDAAAALYDSTRSKQTVVLLESAYLQRKAFTIKKVLGHYCRLGVYMAIRPTRFAGIKDAPNTCEQ